MCVCVCGGGGGVLQRSITPSALDTKKAINKPQVQATQMLLLLIIKYHIFGSSDATHWGKSSGEILDSIHFILLRKLRLSRFFAAF